MRNINDLDFGKALGTYTLLYGETDTKKTYLTAKFIDYIIVEEDINPLDISILDFAPPLSKIQNFKIGGKIGDFSEFSSECQVVPLDQEIIPPRLNAKNKTDLYNNLCHNFKLTSKAIKQYNYNPTKFLIINDVSIYLHLGNKSYLLDTINKAYTFFGNTYYGTSIKTGFGKLLSIKERKRVEFLIRNIKQSFRTK